MYGSGAARLPGRTTGRKDDQALPREDRDARVIPDGLAHPSEFIYLWLCWRAGSLPSRTPSRSTRCGRSFRGSVFVARAWFTKPATTCSRGPSRSTKWQETWPGGLCSHRSRPIAPFHLKHHQTTNDDGDPNAPLNSRWMLAFGSPVYVGLVHLYAWRNLRGKRLIRYLLELAGMVAFLGALATLPRALRERAWLLPLAIVSACRTSAS